MKSRTVAGLPLTSRRKIRPPRVPTHEAIFAFDYLAKAYVGAINRIEVLIQLSSDRTTLEALRDDLEDDLETMRTEIELRRIARTDEGCSSCSDAATDADATTETPQSRSPKAASQEASKTRMANWKACIDRLLETD